MSLPGYDEWKTHDPDDDCCEFCGADPRHNSNGWQPHCCTGECGVRFRDPDAEREERIDRERDIAADCDWSVF